MANERNIDIERHYVTTEDGYILGLYRLPAKNIENNSNGTKTMLMMHGLISSSQMYILYPDRSAGIFIRSRTFS